MHQNINFPIHVQMGGGGGRTSCINYNKNFLKRMAAVDISAAAFILDETSIIYS